MADGDMPRPSWPSAFRLLPSAPSPFLQHHEILRRQVQRHLLLVVEVLVGANVGVELEDDEAVAG